MEVLAEAREACGGEADCPPGTSVADPSSVEQAAGQRLGEGAGQVVRVFLQSGWQGAKAGVGPVAAGRATPSSSRRWVPAVLTTQPPATSVSRPSASIARSSATPAPPAR